MRAMISFMARIVCRVARKRHRCLRRNTGSQRFEEYRVEYGETLLCGYARIGGWAVGHCRESEETRANAGARLDQKRNRIWAA